MQRRSFIEMDIEQQTADQELVGKWNQCLSVIHQNVSEAVFGTWFVCIKPASYENDVLTLFVPSNFVREHLERNYLELLGFTIRRVFGKQTILNYRILMDIDNGLTIDQVAPELKKEPVGNSVRNGNLAPNPIAVAPQDLDPMLKPDYTFDNFIEGLSNKLPLAAADNIARNPGKTIFNPLFLYGASGVGKTHLANAIGLRVKELFPQLRVLYVSAHLFKVQYTDSVRKNTLNDFIYFYQTIDVLIIDDIQEFVGVEKTQNTFFHIFNHLHQNGKQLIMTCDRPPVMLQGIEERLMTRFKWGLTAEIEKPNLELRRNILLNKVSRENIAISDDALEYIAMNVTDSVRELEGILISLMAHSTIYGRDIDLAMAERVVSRAVRVSPREITVNDVLQSTCKYYHVKEEDVFSSSRKREIVQVRQVAMFLAQKHVQNVSLAKIGQCIGSKDHSTVIHACRTIKEQLEVDKALQHSIEKIERMIIVR